MEKTATFYFDMDGTIADLYGIPDWLTHLQAGDSLPYRAAPPMVDVERLTKAIQSLKIKGYRFGVISWLSKNGSRSYNVKVRAAKVRWLNKYFPGLFDEIHIVKYGTPKFKFKKQGCDFLFDDEEKNRIDWNGRAYTEKEIFSQLEW